MGGYNLDLRFSRPNGCGIDLKILATNSSPKDIGIRTFFPYITQNFRFLRSRSFESCKRMLELVLKEKRGTYLSSVAHGVFSNSNSCFYS